MTNKAQTILFACLSGFSGFVNWLCTLAPEQQEGYAAMLVELVPLHWRPNVGVVTRLLMFFLGILTAYKASQTVPTKLVEPVAKVLVALFCASLLSGCEMTAQDWKTVSAVVGETADTTFRAYDGYKVRQNPSYYQQPVQRPITAYPWPTY